MAHDRHRPLRDPLDLAIAILEMKWTLRIVQALRTGPCRFRELHERLPDVAHKVLIQQLRALERDYVVSRRVGVGGARGVSYGLTESGAALVPILDSLDAWGQAHLNFATVMGVDSDQRSGPAAP